ARAPAAVGVPEIKVAVLVEAEIAYFGKISQRGEAATQTHAIQLTEQLVLVDIPLEGQLRRAAWRALLAFRLDQTAGKDKEARGRDEIRRLNLESNDVLKVRFQYLFGPRCGEIHQYNFAFAGSRQL